MKKSFPIFTLLAFLLTTSVIAQSPKILVVTAHPDDETGFSVTMFEITHELKGIVDMVVMASRIRSWELCITTWI